MRAATAEPGVSEVWRRLLGVQQEQPARLSLSVEVNPGTAVGSPGAYSAHGSGRQERRRARPGHWDRQEETLKQREAKEARQAHLETVAGAADEGKHLAGESMGKSTEGAGKHGADWAMQEQQVRHRRRGKGRNATTREDRAVGSSEQEPD